MIFSYSFKMRKIFVISIILSINVFSFTFIPVLTTVQYDEYELLYKIEIEEKEKQENFLKNKTGQFSYVSIPSGKIFQLNQEDIKVNNCLKKLVLPSKFEEYIKGLQGDILKNQEKGEHRNLLKEAYELGHLILVNKQVPLDKNYKPENLIQVKYVAKNRSPVGWKMVERAAEAFNKLSESAKKAGYEIVVTTAYRDYQFQNNLYSRYVKTYGQEEADRFSARPGTSEHQTGLAADVSSPSVQYQLTEDYIDTAEGRWLAENCHKYGFIIRYPKGKEHITGYLYEPWHIRYLGVDIATEIFQRELTLEEFLEENKKLIYEGFI